MLRLFKREPDFYIGGKENPYIMRWYITPWSGWWRQDENGKAIPIDQLNWFQRSVRSLPNIYLHKILRSDDDRALHDHPWWNMSIVLRGGYFEHMPANPKQWPQDMSTTFKVRLAPAIILRSGRAAHRLQLFTDTNGIGANGIACKGELKPTWSLFITGFKWREWGFFCPLGWRIWYKFVNMGKPGEVGPGCDG